MSSEVLFLKFSSDHKFLAVALMDSTVKVFFADTLKFFLSLYGHKLPVLCLDMSTDATIMVTGSQDKNIYIWGMDFGNIHKRLFAHDGSVTGVQFIPKTHMFFSCGKDRKIKQWDADNFQHITTLEGHQSDVWCLAVSPSGHFLASAGHDRSLRVWERSDEIMVLEEEQEKEREKEMEEKLESKGDDMDVVIPGETSDEIARAGKKNKETDVQANRLLEALDLHLAESSVLEEHQLKSEQTKQKLPETPVHIMFQAFGVKTPNEYMLEVMKRLKSSELEESLLVLPFSYVTRLLTILNNFIQSGWEVELSSRCLLFLLRVHCGQITSTKTLMPTVDQLRSNIKVQADTLKDRTGFNLAGLKFLQQQLEEKSSVKLFADATQKQKQKKKKTAILTLRT